MNNFKTKKFRYFGTDGIRGRFEGDFLNEAFVERFGRALGQWFKAKEMREEILIGRDTRASGVKIETALVKGLAEEGLSIVLEGVVPTPALSYLIKESGAIGGVMITASHNPAEDNGLKVFYKDGKKLKGEDELEIENLLEEGTKERVGLSGNLSQIRRGEGVKTYISFVKNLLSKGCLKGWKIVVDTANGATVEAAYEVFKYFGSELICIGNEPNGININQDVGSEHPERLAAVVKANRAQLGICYDGDGDRVLVCDDEGQIVPGDQLLGVLALQAVAEGKLRKNMLVATIQSNGGLDWSLKAKGCQVVRVDVGDRNVLHTMETLGCNLGGESSGHVIYSDLLKSGDGLITGLKLFECLLKTKKSLKDLCEGIRLFPQKTVNMRIKEKKPLMEQVHIQKVLTELEKYFNEKGRLLVRYSGTEPMIRLLVEHVEGQMAQEGMERLMGAVRKDLEVIKDA